MRQCKLITICLMVLALSCLLSGDSATDTDSTTGATLEPSACPPSTPASRPAPATAPAEDDVEKILKALEEAGEKYTTIKAELKYEVVNQMLGDTESRTGWVAYSKAHEDKPAMLRIAFATLSLDDGPEFEEKVDYAFDGERLSVARHKIKQINRYRLGEDQRRRPLKLGEGPFPMPFGQKAEDMLEQFSITTRPGLDDEPEDSDYLKLVPKAEDTEEMRITRIEMWVDRANSLPVKIISASEDRSITTVTLSEVQIDVELEDSVFTLKRRLGWQESVEDLEEGARLTP
ncbi:MAG: LolA family protein [Planctomycetota bacterium]|jgi:hypothetical protein